MTHMSMADRFATVLLVTLLSIGTIVSAIALN
jgi:hypothetical protein